MPSVLALIPAYNESRHIETVVKATRRHLPVLVVDDGSSDMTATLAESAGATVHVQHPNQGKGRALRTGFQWALDNNYHAVLTLDADGQHDPEEIPKFLQMHETRTADLVIGTRDFRHMPPVRRFANTVGTWCFSWAVGRRIPDNQSGYRLLSIDLIRHLMSSSEQGYEFEIEMIVVCVRNGMRLHWVPIRTIYGEEISHIKRGAHVKHFFRMVWQTHKAMQKGSR